MAIRSIRTMACLAAALGVVSCASILGINDRGLDTSDGGGMDAQTDGGTDGGMTGDSPSGSDGSDGGGGGDANCPDPCVLATGLNHPFLMTSDANNVYWTEYGDTLGASNGSVKFCPVAGCGGGGPTVVAMALTNPRGIAVDANNIYYDTASYGPVNGAIWSCAIAGCNGSPTKLAPAGVPFGVAVDATYVYWVDNDDGTIHRTLKAGGGANAVLYDAGDGLIGEPEHCAVDNVALYVTDQFGDVFREPIGGGEPTQMAPGMLGGVWPVVVDSNRVYYGTPGSVVALSKSATDGGTPLATNIQDPDGLALDPNTSRIYWSDWGSGIGTDGTVGRVGVDGSGQSVLASSLVTPEDVATSGPYVFWLSNGTMGDAGDTQSNTGALLRHSK
jgi:hypothetical protein